MKSDAALERELKSVSRIINDGHVGPRGCTKYAVAFAMYDTLLWARGRREEYPSVKLTVQPLEGRHGTATGEPAMKEKA